MAESVREAAETVLKFANHFGSAVWTHERYKNEHGWWSALVSEDRTKPLIDSVLRLLTSEFPNDPKIGDVFEAIAAFKKFAPILAKHILATVTADSDEPVKSWMPIAEAPKDGTHILIGWQGSNMMFISRWLKSAGEWLLPVTTSPVPLKQPTHFHSLPKPLNIPIEPKGGDRG